MTKASRSRFTPSKNRTTTAFSRSRRRAPNSRSASDLWRAIPATVVFRMGNLKSVCGHGREKYWALPPTADQSGNGQFARGHKRHTNENIPAITLNASSIHARAVEHASPLSPKNIHSENAAPSKYRSAHKFWPKI